MAGSMARAIRRTVSKCKRSMGGGGESTVVVACHLGRWKGWGGWVNGGVEVVRSGEVIAQVLAWRLFRGLTVYLWFPPYFFCCVIFNS